jgi:hypothetical protein
MRDSTNSFYRSGFDNQQSSTRQRHLAEMNGVPISRETLVGHVLAHRGNDDAIGQFKWADLEGGEKLAHAILFL